MRNLQWFKHGVQYDVKCNALIYGSKVKHIITVFSYDDTKEDALKLAVDELSKCGYSNITADKIVRNDWRRR
jgi:hypothetical protein